MVPFKSSVDPDGILEEAMGTEFVHLRENEVEYFECVDDGQGRKKWVPDPSHSSITNNCKTRYVTIEPSKLSKGDIVEAQVSFVVIPIKKKKYKPLVILRAITLVDSQPTKVKFIDQE